MDKLYAGLKDLAEERRGRLQDRLRLTQLKREVDDLEQWIAEREVVAGSHELGQDYEHVTVSSFSIVTQTHHKTRKPTKANNISSRHKKNLWSVGWLSDFANFQIAPRGHSRFTRLLLYLFLACNKMFRCEYYCGTSFCIVVHLV